MQVVIKKKVLDQVIKTLAEERSFHSRKYDQIAGDDKPVLPDAQMATQLSKEQLPVSNPDFLPVNKQQAAAAAAQMTSQVDPAKLQKFFSGLKKLIRKTSEPKQYKGMSETDLMEALRPLVLAEAKLSGFQGQGEDEVETSSGGEGLSVDDVIKAFKSKLGQSAWPLTKKNFENLVADFDQDPTGIKSKYPGWQKSDFQAVLDAMSNPAWKPTPVAKTSKPAKDKTPDTDSQENAKKKSRNPRADKPITRNKGVELNKATRDDLKKYRGLWTSFPEKFAQSVISEKRSVPLDVVIETDINRVLDVFKKAKMPIPSTFAESGIQISVISSTETLEGFEDEVPVRTIKFNKPGSNLTFKDLKHSGGPIPVEVEMEDGSREESIYYIVDPYPFEESQYKERFEALFPQIASQSNREAEYTAEKKQRKAEDKEMAALEKAQAAKEKSQRAATLQKKLSLDLAGRDAVAMREENPKKLEKILGNLTPKLTLADYDALSDQDLDDVNKKVMAVLDKERGPYYFVGEMDYLRDIFPEEAEDRYSVSGEEVQSTDPIAYGVDSLSKQFFESALKPAMRDVIEATLEENPDLTEDGIDDIAESYSFDSYEDFIAGVENKSAYIDLVTSESKKILTEKPGIFDSSMPSFEAIRNAVKKDDNALAPFKARLRLLGIGDVGRLRSIFQYLNSPAAFMKAIDVTVRLKELEGKSEIAEEIDDPEKRMKLAVKQINYEIENDVATFFNSNKNILAKVGIDSVDAVDKKRSAVIKAVAPIRSEMLAKSIKSLAKQGLTGDIEEKIRLAIEAFIDAINLDFVDLADVTDPSSKPILDYIKQVVTKQADIVRNKGFSNISTSISKTVDKMIKGQAKPAPKKK